MRCNCSATPNPYQASVSWRSTRQRPCLLRNCKALLDNMKRLSFLLMVLLPMMAFAEDIKRADGTVIQGTIVRGEPDGLVVQTDAGVEQIDFVFLSTELQRRFNYEPAKAEAYRASQVAARKQVVSQQVAQQMAAIRAQAAAVD